MYRIEQRDSTYTDQEMIDPEVRVLSDDEESIDAFEVEDTPEYTWVNHKYTPKQVGELIRSVRDLHLKPKEAASKAGIKIASAYKFLKQHEENPLILPGYKLTTQIVKPCHHQKTEAKHSAFIEQCLQMYPLSTMKDIQQKITECFQGMIATSLLNSTATESFCYIN